MGEIKSTLELVMERTRHLQLSAEEKARQKKDDFDKRLAGLLQRYADGGLSVDLIKDRIGSLQAELEVKDRRAVVAGIVGRIDPDQDAEPWLDLIAAMATPLRRPLETVLSDYLEGRRTRLRESENRCREQLAGRHGITGPAVVPNPMKDEACRANLAALRQQVLDRLQDAVDQILPSDQT